MNRRVDIREDIKRYKDTLSYTSSKVDYSVEQNIYMLPSDMNLKIRSGTVGYDNKILISNEKFSLGKNENVNLMAPVMKSHKYSKTNSLEPTTIESHSTTTQGLTHAPTISHEDEKIALVISLAGIFTIWYMFR